MKKTPCRLISLTLTAALLPTLFGCTLYGPKREFVTEDPPIRSPDDTYVETVEEQRLQGSVLAVCGEDLIRVEVDQGYIES